MPCYSSNYRLLHCSSSSVKPQRYHPPASPPPQTAQPLPQDKGRDINIMNNNMFDNCYVPYACNVISLILAKC